MGKINILFGTGKQGLAKYAPFVVILVALLSIIMAPIFIKTGELAFIFYAVLLVLIAIAVPLVRVFDNRASKMVGYMALGISSFWIVGAAYSELEIFGQFLPVLIFAFAIGIAIEIALVEGVIYSYIFSAFGFVAVVFNLLYSGLDYVGGKPDILLLIAALWTLVPMLWCYFLTKTTKNLQFNAINIISATIKSAILTIPVYLLLGAAILLSQQSHAGFDIPSMSRVIELAGSADLTMILVGASWYYILAHLVMVVGIFFINSAVLHAFNIDKEFNEEGDIIYSKITEGQISGLDDVDPYRQVIKEMKDYNKDFNKGKINRITATQALGKFRRKMDVLTSKYERGSKDDASKLLMQLEQDAEFTFG